MMMVSLDKNFLEDLYLVKDSYDLSEFEKFEQKQILALIECNQSW